jgi:hypothetical protein
MSRYYKYNGLWGLEKWSNTEKFKEAGMRFQKDGAYTHFTEGTYAYKEFWDNEKYKMKNGITIDGQTISGLHYLYLNYCPIYNKSKKKFEFPDFWDLDADWFKQIDRAEFEGKYIVALKARQKGFSLKDMVPFVRNLHFRRNSANYLASYLDAHASKSWVFVKNYLNHINKYTDFYKNRNPDTTEAIRMAYPYQTKDGRKVEGGLLSELHKIVLKDNPAKGVGGACDLFVYEEGGIVPGDHLLQTLEYVKPATMDGAAVTGLIIVYGSVGDLDKSTSLKKLFMQPGNNGFMEFENIWNDDVIGNNKCGYFVPQYICYKEPKGYTGTPFIDKDGNSDAEAALHYIRGEREKKKKLGGKQFITYITQNPIKPSEAFLSNNRNKFPIDLLQSHLARLENNNALKNWGYAIKLHNDQGAIKPEMLHNVTSAFHEYPIDPKTQLDIEGTIWVYEPPQSENKLNNLYISSTDSINQEVAPTSDSIFVTYVYKRNPGTLVSEGMRDQLVASYVGRKEIPEDMYNITMNLLEWYGCKNLCESDSPGMINYFRNMDKSYLLQDEMDEIKGLNPTSKVNRKKGYHATKEQQNHGDDLILTYLKEPIGYEYEEDGLTIKRVIYGLERILDRGLIKELIEYNDEDNFDRVTAFRGLMLYKEALFKITVKKETSGKSIYAQAGELAKMFQSNPTRILDIWNSRKNSLHL